MPIILAVIPSAGITAIILVPCRPHAGYAGSLMASIRCEIHQDQWGATPQSFTARLRSRQPISKPTGPEAARIAVILNVIDNQHPQIACRTGIRTCRGYLSHEPPGIASFNATDDKNTALPPATDRDHRPSANKLRLMANPPRAGPRCARFWSAQNVGIVVLVIRRNAGRCLRFNAQTRSSIRAVARTRMRPACSVNLTAFAITLIRTWRSLLYHSRCYWASPRQSHER